MELDEVADELYGLRPEEFTAARDDRARRARADGRRELAQDIRALRRPTLAAWAGNLLVRERGGQVAPLLRLGEELREAHRNLDGEELRALSHKQHQLVDALVTRAERLTSQAGSPIGPQARQEVARTLHAVLADPDAAREWAAGRLSKPLTATPGFEAAAREAASGAGRGQRRKPGPAAKRSGTKQGGQGKPGKQGKAESRTGRTRTARTAEEDRKAAQAEREAREAAGRADRLRREAEAAAEQTATSRANRKEAERRVERLRGELRDAEEAREEWRRREREAERAEREARREADTAEEAGRRARRGAGTSADTR